METKKSLSTKILVITLKIKEQYPELGKYLEEMPITIPTKKKLIITPIILQEYYDSLVSLLNKYLLVEFCNNEMD